MLVLIFRAINDTIPCFIGPSHNCSVPPTVAYRTFEARAPAGSGPKCGQRPQFHLPCCPFDIHGLPIGHWVYAPCPPPLTNCTCPLPESRNKHNAGEQKTNTTVCEDTEECGPICGTGCFCIGPRPGLSVYYFPICIQQPLSFQQPSSHCTCIHFHTPNTQTQKPQGRIGPTQSFLDIKQQLSYSVLSLGL